MRLVLPRSHSKLRHLKQPGLQWHGRGSNPRPHPTSQERRCRCNHSAAPTSFLHASQSVERRRMSPLAVVSSILSLHDSDAWNIDGREHVQGRVWHFQPLIYMWLEERQIGIWCLCVHDQLRLTHISLLGSVVEIASHYHVSLVYYICELANVPRERRLTLLTLL